MESAGSKDPAHEWRDHYRHRKIIRSAPGHDSLGAIWQVMEASMREPDLRLILAMLGVTPTGRKRASGWIEFRCPLAPFTHAGMSDTRPSASAKVNDLGRSLWSCQTCKAHGGISSLVNELQHYRREFYGSVITAITRAEQAALSNAPVLADVPFEYVPEGPQPLIEEQFIGLYPPAGADRQSRAYLLSRGIHSSTVDKLGLLWDNKAQRILFPVRDREGRLFGFTGRLTIAATKEEPKVRDYHGLPKRDLVLGAERWRRGKPLIIVEGLFGYAHLHEIGAEDYANIGAILGSAVTPEKAAMIRNTDEQVYWLLDNDEAGEVGIFGRLLPGGERESSTSALGQTTGYVTNFVPAWPTWNDPEHKSFGLEKDDPDQLTLQEVQDMLLYTAPV